MEEIAFELLNFVNFVFLHIKKCPFCTIICENTKPILNYNDLNLLKIKSNVKNRYKHVWEQMSQLQQRKDF